MPRSPSGEYTLPLPPVITGTPVESSWANSTMDDLAQALTDSLSRSAQGAMQAVFRAVDGSEAAPSIGFINEASSGLYRPLPGAVYLAVMGTNHMRWTAGNGVEVSTDGLTWNVVTTQDIVTDLQNQITQNATDISANTDSIVILSGRIDQLAVTFTTNSLNATSAVVGAFRSNGEIRHVLNDQGGGNAAIAVSTHNRHYVSNNGPLTLTFSGIPNADDPELGAYYQVEGQVIIENTASPGAINIAGITVDHSIGSASNTPNEAMILTYLLQYSNGVTRNVFVWSAV